MKITSLSILVLLLITSCSSTSTVETTAKKNDVRQGEEVKQICFASSINGWRELKGQRRSVILTKGVNDEFKVDLSGVCDVSQAMMKIGTRSRGSSCLTRGDDILVDNGFSGVDRCMITKIYIWNADKQESNDSAEAPVNEVTDTQIVSW